VYMYHTYKLNRPFKKHPLAHYSTFRAEDAKRQTKREDNFSHNRP
jgi:hypothetical protein